MSDTPYPNGKANTLNQRIPDLQQPGVYPYIEFTQFRDGSWERRCVDSGFESYSSGHVLGNYEETDYLGNHKHLHTGMQHIYALGGKSETTEGNHDEKIDGGHVAYVQGDHYSEFGNNHLSAIFKNLTHVIGGNQDHIAVGSSTIATSGDAVHDTNDGSEHKNIMGDHIRFTGGVKYDSVGSEHGLYVQGNSDTKAEKKLNIECGDTLTIKVSNSIITITGSNVNITDSNNNQIGMTSSKMWIKPTDDDHIIYIGGPGKNANLYAPVATSAGPAINFMAKFKKEQE